MLCMEYPLFVGRFSTKSDLWPNFMASIDLFLIKESHRGVEDEELYRV